ncbi:hypothetical protein EMCRGX_G004353 [Ephydatia muelleri]
MVFTQARNYLSKLTGSQRRRGLRATVVEYSSWASAWKTSLRMVLTATMSSALIVILVLVVFAGKYTEGQPPVINTPIYFPPGYTATYVNNFVKQGNYFTSPLNFDAVPGMIVVGGNMLYLLSSNLSNSQDLSVCSSGMCPNNLVRLYSAPSANSATLVVCGSAGPQCSLVDTSSGNFTLTSEYVSSSPSLLTSDPNTPSLGIFTNITTARKTNFFAASGTSLTFHTFNTSDPTSLGTSLKFGINSTHNAFNLTTWFSSLLVIVDVYKADYPMRGFIPPGVTDNRNPDEHKYLFVFVREQDPMTSTVTNKLARLCQNDPGSVSAPNGLPFPTTLLKANISCQSASGPMKQNLLQGVVFSRPGRYYSGGEWVELMYGTFIDYTGYSPQTSICVYRANDSDYSLASGANNKGVFDIFRSQVYDPVGGRNIANNYVECTPNGRTDLQSQQINLAQSIQQYNPEPLAILSNVAVTKMAVDQSCVLFNGSTCVTQDILFLGTSAGSILKMTMVSLNGAITPLISDNYNLADTSSVRQMVIRQQDEEKYLFVNTNNGVYKLPLQRCSQYSNCSNCMASRDPYCVWNVNTHKCVRYTSDLNTSMLYQNITSGTHMGCTNEPSPTSSAIYTTSSATYTTSSATPSSTATNPILPSIAGVAQQTNSDQSKTVVVGVVLGSGIVMLLVVIVVLVLYIIIHRSHGSHDMPDSPGCNSPNGRSSVAPLMPEKPNRHLSVEPNAAYGAPAEVQKKENTTV